MNSLELPDNPIFTEALSFAKEQRDYSPQRRRGRAKKVFRISNAWSKEAEKRP
jgi:hypothetical protein